MKKFIEILIFFTEFILFNRFIYLFNIDYYQLIILFIKIHIRKYFRDKYNNLYRQNNYKQ